MVIRKPKSCREARLAEGPTKYNNNTLYRPCKHEYMCVLCALACAVRTQTPSLAVREYREKRSIRRRK